MYGTGDDTECRETNNNDVEGLLSGYQEDPYLPSLFFTLCSYVGLPQESADTEVGYRHPLSPPQGEGGYVQGEEKEEGR